MVKKIKKLSKKIIEPKQRSQTGKIDVRNSLSTSNIQSISALNFAAIEKKWQAAWEKAKVFEAKPDQRKKLFFTTPYPYISGSLHLGHGRAGIESDMYCRYMRMDGYNVLYPLAFHITGTPVLGISAAIKNGDKHVIAVYESYVAAYEKNSKKVKSIVQSF